VTLIKFFCGLYMSIGLFQCSELKQYLGKSDQGHPTKDLISRSSRGHLFILTVLKREIQKRTARRPPEPEDKSTCS